MSPSSGLSREVFARLVRASGGRFPERFFSAVTPAMRSYCVSAARLLAELLFREWAAENRVGNQHFKFSLALYAVDGLVVHRTSPRSYKDMNNLFLFAMLAVNRNFGLFHA
jgi:hypothetical protein